MLALGLCAVLCGMPAHAQTAVERKDESMRTYYVDGLAGSDENDGQTPETAWRTLERVNALTLAPGSRVLLRAGSLYNGTLKPRGLGEKGRLVEFGRYGEGRDPVINAGGAFAAVFLQNMSYVRVSHLEITNVAPAADETRCGVYVECGGADTPGGCFREIYLEELHIHDVTTRPGRQGGGIVVDTRAAENPVTYEDVVIEGCSVRNTNGNGITFTSAYSQRTGIDWATQPYTPSRRVTIRNNFIYNCGGDGIFQSCAEDPVLSHNTVYGTSWAGDVAYAGIWPHNSTGAVVSHNEAYGQRLVGGDGQGFDVDINCKNTVVEYNYSHHNDGGFLLLCTSGDQGGWNDDVTVRYNISEDDRGQIFTLSGPITNIKIYNNTVSFREGLNPRLIGMYQWGNSGGGPDKVTVENNIFAINGTGRNTFYPDTDVSFAHNLFFGSYDIRDIDDPGKIVGDPLFAGDEPLYGISNGSGFSLREDSPAFASVYPSAFDDTAEAGEKIHMGGRP